ncbi:hypothetical protein CUR178_02204 [Leishmania enriettii]|uniref:Uncharacterized protein n=1 Tax=Leishmania enriettii TaxID=5663 RepID=A0A836GW55_LEIEN|nr:hypothetical protein CUR178_02204 [Leishmania enriettii]
MQVDWPLRGLLRASWFPEYTASVLASRTRPADRSAPGSVFDRELPIPPPSSSLSRASLSVDVR